MSSSNKENQHQTLLHLWNNGICTGTKLHKLMNILLSTIYDNIKKHKKNGTNTHARGNGWWCKITADVSRKVGQYVRRNHSISTRILESKLLVQNIQVSHSTIARHLVQSGYQNNRPVATPMLTPEHKRKRVEWAKRHLKDNWKRPYFLMRHLFSYSVILLLLV